MVFHLVFLRNNSDFHNVIGNIWTILIVLYHCAGFWCSARPSPKKMRSPDSIWSTLAYRIIFCFCYSARLYLIKMRKGVDRLRLRRRIITLLICSFQNQRAVIREFVRATKQTPWWLCSSILNLNLTELLFNVRDWKIYVFADSTEVQRGFPNADYAVVSWLYA